MGCADEATLRALTKGQLPREQAFALTQHLVDCDACSARLADVEADAARPRTVGRYVVLDELGRGGMGRVLRGYDPQLERFVAIKRLLDAAPDDTAQARLLREAQAMAKVVHPHLVSVFDAGLSDGDVYLVMEFVKGPTLAQWLDEAPRTWREVLRLFLQAGQGLSAAHAAGLVHRDFKPSNVLVQDGVAKVTDFGLALAAAPSSAPVATGKRELTSSGAAARVTRAGVNPGTPEYMAPEQFRGTFDARSDQFSFARCLEEALARRNPPRWVIDALRPALATDPQARYPSMSALLDALSPEARARSALTVQVSLAVAVLLAGGVAVARSRRVDCSTAGQAIAAVWNAPARAALAAHLGALPADVATRVQGALDGWASKWAERSRASCEATSSGAQSGHVELLRRLCLERRLSFFSTVVEQSTRASAERLISTTAELPEVDCSDEELLATGAADESDELRTRLQPLRLSLGRVEALTFSGDDGAALALGEQVLVEARDAGFPPVLAEAATLVGQRLTRSQPTRARALFQEAQGLISSLRTVPLATAHVGARSSLELLDTYGGEPQAFEALRPITEAAIARAGGGDAWQAAYQMYLGRALLARGEPEAAVGPMRRAYELRLAVAGPDAERTRSARANLAVALEGAGQTDEALVHLEALVASTLRLYGPRSILYARALAQLGATEVVAVRYQRATEHLEAARALLDALGAEEDLELEILDNLASLAELRGDFAAARPLRERLLSSVAEPSLHAKYAGLMSRVLLELGRRDDARTQAVAARDVLRTINPTHADLLVPLTTLGRLTPGAEGERLLVEALGLPEARDPEYRGDACLALALRSAGATRARWLEEARKNYAEGEVAFRVQELAKLK
jgi:tetratricopeptide (TPR) repeat protein